MLFCCHKKDYLVFSRSNKLDLLLVLSCDLSALNSLTETERVSHRINEGSPKYVRNELVS